MIYVSEHISVVHYICWNRLQNNGLHFSTPTIFFSPNFQLNFDLYCSPPPLTPLILLTLTLTPTTLECGHHCSRLLIFSPCNVNSRNSYMHCDVVFTVDLRKMYLLHNLPWVKSQEKPSQEPYLILVIFFTRANFLENKIYTEKTHKLRQNTQ